MHVDPGREVALPGGRVTAGVVRVGDTVRRPTREHSAFVHELLRLLEQRGVGFAPRLIGVDEHDREILSFHEGWVPPNLEWRRWSDRQLAAAATLVRELHDATAGSHLARGAEVVCHGDLSPCNFVFVDGEPRFLIDFDGAHADSRKSDLAYMAWAWLIGREDETHAPSFDDRLGQLPLLLESYGLVDRSEFAAAIEAEQKETLSAVLRRGDVDAGEWVNAEIRFMRAHADAVNSAALSKRRLHAASLRRVSDARQLQ